MPSIFPPDQVTPLGISKLQQATDPFISYTSPDGDVFYLSGGLEPVMGITEGVVMAEAGLDGLSPPFSHLDHKGARQAGVTWSDTVYDPAEITMKVTCTGQTPAGLRNVMRKWFAAWDPKRQGTLTIVTPENGVWTAKVRLAKEPPEKLERGFGQRGQQTFTWYIRNDSAFWQGTNSLSQLGVSFESAADSFNRQGNGSLGANWQQTYSGPGGGACGANNGAATWAANDPNMFFTGTKNVTCGPFKNYNTATDLQTVSWTAANTPVFTLGTGAANYLWGRMGSNPDGTWNGYGVRAAIGWGFCQIAVFNNFVPTVLAQWFQLIPPIIGEVFTFYVGSSTDPYDFKLVRDNFFNICEVSDTGHVSQMGVNYRGVGFGLQAGGAILNQATPAYVSNVSSGGVTLDNFQTTTTTGLGPNWPLYYSSGTGVGYVRAAGGVAQWVDTALGRNVFNRWLGASETQTVTVNGNPGFWNLTYKGPQAMGQSQTTASIPGGATATQVQSALTALPAIGAGNVSVTGTGPYQVTFTGALANTPMNAMYGTVVSGGVNPYVQVGQTTPGFNQLTATDNQVVSVQLGNPFSFPWPSTAYINVYGRLNTNDAAPTGVAMQIGPQWISVFAVVAGVWHQIGFTPLLIAPLWNETWSLVCGTSTNVLQFAVQRDGQTIYTCTDTTGLSSYGAGFRGSGFGMSAGDGQFVQNIPPAVELWQMGDNSGITMSGHLSLTNFGDQDAYPDYVVFGPGTFTFSDGPGGTPTVAFGPLVEGQIALLRTDPGLRGVYDISVNAASTTLSGYSQYIQQLQSLTVNNNIQPLLNWFQSEFGVTPPQGNMYSLLQGRFSQPIPANSITQQVAVTITGANATTQVIGVITPEKRWPL